MRIRAIPRHPLSIAEAESVQPPIGSRVAITYANTASNDPPGFRVRALDGRWYCAVCLALHQAGKREVLCETWWSIYGGKEIINVDLIEYEPHEREVLWLPAKEEEA